MKKGDTHRTLRYILLWARPLSGFRCRRPEQKEEKGREANHGHGVYTTHKYERTQTNMRKSMLTTLMTLATTTTLIHRPRPSRLRQRSRSRFQPGTSTLQPQDALHALLHSLTQDPLTQISTQNSRSHRLTRREKGERERREEKWWLTLTVASRGPRVSMSVVPFYGETRRAWGG